MSATQRWVESDQTRLAVTEGGRLDGTTVIFLHADSGEADQWREVADLLAPHYHVVRFDFRGHGASGPARNGDYSFSGRAMDLGAVIAAVKANRIVLVGHSGGAAVALSFAARNSTKLAAILLVEPATDPRKLPKEMREGFKRDLAGPNGLKVLKDYYISIAGDNPAVVQRVMAACDKTIPAARAGVGAALSDWDPEPTLKAWHGSMLMLVSSANDTEAALYRLHPDVPYRVIGDTGHWLQIEKSEIVAEAIRELDTAR